MIEKVSYGGWKNVYRLYNNQVEALVTADVGPRVIRFGFIGQANMFQEVADHLGKTGGDVWRSYGGHRFWHAPEHPERTYSPDNGPVDAKITGSRLHVVQPVEAITGIQKEIEITLDERDNHVHIVHRLRNHNLWAVELAPWALSVMAPGGVGILPQPPKGSHPEDLLPATSLVLWAYTDMADPRWTWGNRYILLRQHTGPEAVPQKIGMLVSQGWGAYANDGRLFLKKFQVQPQATYPDRGASLELFTNSEMLELETLGPTTTLEPNADVVHEEDWYLFADVPMPGSDTDVERDVMPKVTSVLA